MNGEVAEFQQADEIVRVAFRRANWCTSGACVVVCVGKIALAACSFVHTDRPSMPHSEDCGKVDARADGN